MTGLKRNPHHARRALVRVALGREPADEIIEGGVLVNVATSEIYPADVAIKGNRIAAVGDVSYTRGAGTAMLDASGRYITPGLIDSHLHCYHSYLGIPEFVESMVSRGITATADGFYGQGIVGGRPAVDFFRNAFADMPIRLIFLAPVVAYLQNRELGLTPTPGVAMDDLFAMLDEFDCVGLEEPPSLPIVQEQDEFQELLEAALLRRKVVTGHAADVDERQLQAYIAMGAYTDHEMVSRDEAVARARLGMKLFAREGSGCPDVAEVVKAFSEAGVDPRAFAFCTDVLSPEKLVREGGIDEAVRVAIRHGVTPPRAIQMATINAAESFYLQHDIGIVAPGRYADLLLVEDLTAFRVTDVIVGGERVLTEGAFTAVLPRVEYPAEFRATIRLAEPRPEPSDLSLPLGERSSCEVTVIGVNDGSLETDVRVSTLAVVNGTAQPDLASDVLPIAMLDRHGKGTGVGLGFVQGFGLKRGAVASSVNAVCENVLVVGTDYADMAFAIGHIAAMGGGKVAVAEGEVLAAVELPVLGLVSDDPSEVVSRKFARLFEAIAELGCTLRNPLSQLEFCGACGEIPSIKLSEEGLVLVPEGTIVPPVRE